jgi:hypothetical protein
MNALPEYIDGLPNICGSEDLIATVNRQSGPFYLAESGIDFSKIKSAFSIALHMHQPLIPAGGGDLSTAAIISNLKYMMDNQGIGDNHNAPVFHWCYKRVAEFIPQMVNEGKQPRVMLDYSGNLLHGLRAMGLDDVIDSLKTITCDPRYRSCVEWLGTPWSHAVAPSTPVQDYRLHVQAWRHHFGAIFGLEALARVKGFSPSEMALPNHPDVAYEFVKTLKDNGFLWVLIQEHSVEQLNGQGIEKKHLPHRLVCKNSLGEEISIMALIKTQGSDTKLVAQMQPYYEAKGLSRWELAGQHIPPLVTQIGDGENGGVMMNEFPGMFFQVMGEASHSETPALNGTEYLEYLFSLGLKEEDFPAIQPLFQHRIWQRHTPSQKIKGAEAHTQMEQLIASLKKEDGRFHMDGGSWTNDLSWVKGYENVLGPMDEVSALFAKKVLGNKKVKTHEHRYRNALYYLLLTQTSCYRYWGQGLWTDYARELCRRASDIMHYDF